MKSKTQRERTGQNEKEWDIARKKETSHETAERIKNNEKKRDLTRKTAT